MKFQWQLHILVIKYLLIKLVTGITPSMQALALAQAAKVDRKLYIGNLPTGITPSTVR
jgi:hypothetical protein